MTARLTSLLERLAEAFHQASALEAQGIDLGACRREPVLVVEDDAVVADPLGGDAILQLQHLRVQTDPVALEPGEQLAAVPRREAGRYAARVRSLLRVDEADAEDRRDVPVAEVGAVGDEVLDGGQDAVGGAALAVGDSELARATEAAVDEPGLVGRAPLVEAVRG